MSQPLLVLEEVLAMLKVVDVSPAKIAAFKRQAETVLGTRTVAGADGIVVQSGYGSVSQRGFVELSLNDVERVQMDVAKAREIGGMLIEAASAAASDETVAWLLRERVGLTNPEQLGAILLDLRTHRQGGRTGQAH